MRAAIEGMGMGVGGGEGDGTGAVVPTYIHTHLTPCFTDGTHTPLPATEATAQHRLSWRSAGGRAASERGRFIVHDGGREGATASVPTHLPCLPALSCLACPALALGRSGEFGKVQPMTPPDARDGSHAVAGVAGATCRLPAHRPSAIVHRPSSIVHHPSHPAAAAEGAPSSGAGGADSSAMLFAGEGKNVQPVLSLVIACPPIMAEAEDGKWQIIGNRPERLTSLAGVQPELTQSAAGLLEGRVEGEQGPRGAWRGVGNVGGVPDVWLVRANAPAPAPATHIDRSTVETRTRPYSRSSTMASGSSRVPLAAALHHRLLNAAVEESPRTPSKCRASHHMATAASTQTPMLPIVRTINGRPKHCLLLALPPSQAAIAPTSPQAETASITCDMTWRLGQQLADHPQAALSARRMPGLATFHRDPPDLKLDARDRLAT